MAENLGAYAEDPGYYSVFNLHTELGGRKVHIQYFQGKAFPGDRPHVRQSIEFENPGGIEPVFVAEYPIGPGTDFILPDEILIAKNGDWIGQLKQKFDSEPAVKRQVAHY